METSGCRPIIATFIAATAFVVPFGSPAMALTVAWTGAADTALDNPANWDGLSCPTNTDTAVFNTAALPVVSLTTGSDIAYDQMQLSSVNPIRLDVTGSLLLVTNSTASAISATGPDVAFTGGTVRGYKLFVGKTGAPTPAMLGVTNTALTVVRDFATYAPGDTLELGEGSATEFLCKGIEGTGVGPGAGGILRVRDGGAASVTNSHLYLLEGSRLEIEEGASVFVHQRLRIGNGNTRSTVVVQNGGELSANIWEFKGHDSAVTCSNAVIQARGGSLTSDGVSNLIEVCGGSTITIPSDGGVSGTDCTMLVFGEGTVITNANMRITGTRPRYIVKDGARSRFTNFPYWSGIRDGLVLAENGGCLEYVGGRNFDWRGSSGTRVMARNGGLIDFVSTSGIGIDGTNNVFVADNGKVSLKSTHADGIQLGTGYFNGATASASHSPAIECIGTNAQVLITGHFTAALDNDWEHPAELRFAVPAEGSGQRPRSPLQTATSR